MTAHSRQSGQGPTSTVGPGQNRNRTLPLTLTLLGTLIVIGTYVAVLLTQPANLGIDFGHTTLWVMLGYLGGGILLAAGTSHSFPQRSRTHPGRHRPQHRHRAGHRQLHTRTALPRLDRHSAHRRPCRSSAGAFTGIISNLIWV